MGIVSYAQNFEDVMLWRVLGDVPQGCYIDVGAQHPVVDSVSKAFYENGWRGIHVEPTTMHANLLRADRPDEIVVQAVVAESAGVLPFYEIPDTGLSTARKDIAEEHQTKHGWDVRATAVTAITLDDLLELAQSEEIHWLKIDVEGFEKEVLSGWRKSPRRPWVVVVEATYPLSTVDTFEDWESLILEKGYALVYQDGLNRFYLSHDQERLQTRFHFPPNVFDGFQISGNRSWMTTQLRIRLEQESVNALAQKAALEEQLASIKSAFHTIQEEAERRESALQALSHQTQAAARERTEFYLNELLNHEYGHSERLHKQQIDASAREATLRRELTTVLEEAKRTVEAQQNLQASATERIDALLNEQLRQQGEHAAELLKQQAEAHVRETALQAEVAAILAAAQRETEAQREALAERERYHADEHRALLRATQESQDALREESTQARSHALHEYERQTEQLYESQQLALKAFREEFATSRAGLEAALAEAWAREKALSDRLRHANDEGRQRDQQQQKERLEQAQAYANQIIANQANTEARERTEREQAAEALVANQRRSDAQIAVLVDHNRALVEKLISSERDARRREIGLQSAHKMHIVELRREWQDQQNVLMREAKSREAAWTAERQRMQIEIAHQLHVIRQLFDDINTLRRSWPWRLLRPLLFRSFLESPESSHPMLATSVSAALLEQKLSEEMKPPSMHSLLSSGNLTKTAISRSERIHGITRADIMNLDELLALSSQRFLQAAYHTILGREPDSNGLAYYRKCLRRGRSKSAILVELMQSNEAHERIKRDGSELTAKELWQDLLWLSEEEKRMHGIWGWLKGRARLEYRLARIEVSLDIAMQSLKQQLEDSLDKLPTDLRYTEHGSNSPIRRRLMRGRIVPARLRKGMQ